MNTNNFKIAIVGFENNPFKTAITITLAKALKNKYFQKIQIADCNIDDLQLKNNLNTNVVEELPVEVKFPEIDLSKCNLCGDCVGICENEAILLDKLMSEIQVLEDLCMSCNKCIECCGVSAISEKKAVQAGKIICSTTEEGMELFEAKSNENAIYPKQLINALKNKMKNNEPILFDTVISDITFEDIISNIDFILLFTDSRASLDFFSDLLEYIEKRKGLLTYKNNPDIKQIQEFAQKNNFEFVFEIPFNPGSEEIKTKDILEDFNKNMNSFEELSEKFFI
ncbi:MAG: 4Fe-4S binding protein [Bacteroidales bacterium]|jgi:MinD superfamily P-loop ATPase